MGSVHRDKVDDYSLLERVLTLSSRKAQTVESLSQALGIPEKDLYIYWIAANQLRRIQGHHLPTPFCEGPNGAEVDARLLSPNWYSSTWHLSKILEEFQVNEGLAAHYGDILYEPEGGHYQLNLAAREVVLAVQMEHDTIDPAQMMRVCVHACEPTNGIELLVCNAGKILLSIESYREEPMTPAFIERVYDKLTEGISIREVHEIEEQGANVVEDLRSKALESFCATLWPQEEDDGLRNHSLIDALIALHFFKSFRLFPAGNGVFAFLMYVIVLHRAGYHYSAHVPVVKSLYTQGRDSEDQRHSFDPETLVVECDGYCDWTRFFEYAAQAVVGEQRWMMTRLDGMSRRRERFRVIIDADETMNFRQKEVLLEAILHSNAEFTYGIHEQRYDVSYPCARSDFARLLDLGFLRQLDDGTRHFFVASDTFGDVFLEYLKEHCPEAYDRYYSQDGLLRDEYKSTDEAAVEYNKDIGFYEKLLLDKTYIEHFDYRRTTIADYDGPHERDRKRD